MAKSVTIKKCVCCNAEIKSIHGDLNKNDWSGMWLNGVVDKISANYGSSRDGDMFTIAICDSCIAQKESEGVIQYVGNYMENK